MNRFAPGYSGSVGAVDVVIPAYNAEKASLAAAVRSAAACEAARRVIVVDDGSREPVAATWGDTPVPVEVIHQPNAGPSAARNRGIEAATADWVLFLDSDDELIPGGVAALLRGAERIGATAALGAQMEVSRAGDETPKPVPDEWRDKVVPWTEMLRPTRLVGGSGCLVSRRALDRSGAPVRFDESLRIGEDRDFLCRVGEATGVYVSPEPVIRARIHGPGSDNLTSMGHLARRIADHRAIVNRYQGRGADHHLRNATRWLINAASKTGVSRADWSVLLLAARDLRMGVPLKSRIRRLITARRTAAPVAAGKSAGV